MYKNWRKEDEDEEVEIEAKESDEKNNANNDFVHLIIIM
jgi:hypothetical protein